MADEVLQYIVIDDNSEEASELADELEKAGLSWTLVAHYLTLLEARTATVETQLPGVHIAFVDGNLSKHSTGALDGLIMNHILEEHAPHVLRVGNSLSHGKPEDSEIFVNKYYYNHDALREVDRLARERLR